MAQENLHLQEQLVWLLKVSRSLLATRDIDELLVLITDAFIELTHADRCFVMLKDPTTGFLMQRMARTADRTPTPGPETRLQALMTRVFSEAHPIYVTDAATGGSTAGSSQKMVVCMPLGNNADPCGVLYADGTADAQRPFTQPAAEILADHAAAALENARLFERATNDPLTGLPNSSYFLLQLAKVVQEAHGDAPAGLLLLDLDRFKRVNLAAGAEAGDRALIDIANTLQDVLRADGLVARYGSDKFAVLLPPETGSSVVLRLRDVSERARAAVGTKTFHGVRLSVCIGGVAFPSAATPTPSPGDLVALTDDILAKARARGPGEIEIAAP